MNKQASLCSAHFEPESYAGNAVISLEGMEAFKQRKVLIKGSVPTRDTIIPAAAEAAEVPTERKRRQVSSHEAFILFL